MVSVFETINNENTIYFCNVKYLQILKNFK